MGDLSVMTVRCRFPEQSVTAPARAADVDWYQFTLDSPARVLLLASSQTVSPNFHPILSLYNNDPYDFGDLYEPTGHRLIARSDSSTSKVSLTSTSCSVPAPMISPSAARAIFISTL